MIVLVLRQVFWRLSVVLAVSTQPLATLAEPLTLQLPIACTLGETCEIQHYVDRDAGPGAMDHQCGTLTYDGHDGTDFRLPSMIEQKAGVNVLSAAAGRVLRVRDGMDDQGLPDGSKETVAGRECGNGVVIAHRDGWETQYCHLARGSIRVNPGEEVAAGASIGLVGLSGATEFPHVHFTVRKAGTVIDPFAFRPEDGSCGSGHSLWHIEVRDAIRYKAGTVLNVGFATAPVSMNDIETGNTNSEPVREDAPALIAFARAIGLRAGDEQQLVVLGPDGKTFASSQPSPLERNKAQVMVFAGRKRPAAGWPPGAYTATYTVTRAGTPILKRTFEMSW